MNYKDRRRKTRKIGEKTYSKNTEINNKILITSGAGIGNLINLTPLIIKVKECYPDASIDLLTLERNKDVLKGWDVINKIYCFPDDNKEFIQNEYDFIIEGMPKVAQYEGILKPHTTSYKGDYNGMINKHEIIAHLDILNQLNIKYDSINHTYMHISIDAYKLINRKFQDEKYIAVCPGHATEWLPQKNWGYENFGSLVKLLIKAFKGYKILLIGTGDQKEVLKYAGISKRIINCIDKYSIQESAAIIQKCEFVVGNDTGTIHIASALDIPSYVIFGPGCIEKNKPQNKTYIISKYLQCSPCDFDRHRANSCQHIDCMKITPNEIIETILASIGRKGLTKYKYDLGCWITVYNRYDLLLAMMTNILKCRGLKNIKFVICNDGSTDEKIKPLLELFVKKLKSMGNTIVYIRHDENWGKSKYDVTLKQCFMKLMDCKFQMAIPADWIFNEYLFEVARESMQYMKGNVKGISFHTMANRVERINEKIEFFKYFTQTFLIDWFPAIFDSGFVNQFILSMHNFMAESGTGTTRTILLTAKRNGYKFLKYEKSLGQHIGCLTSGLNIEYRKNNPFYMGKLNLWEKPRMLEEKI